MRLALRRLLSSPAFTIAAMLTMAIAIGATASVFGLVDAVLLKAFPYRDPDRVMAIWERNAAMQLPKYSLTVPAYLDLRAQSHAFADVAASAIGVDGTVTGEGEPQRVRTLEVTPNYFSVLGLTPVLGRALVADSSSLDEVVIGYAYWQRQFGGARSVLGQPLTIDDRRYTIVGVAPPGVPDGVELWVRGTFTPENVTARAVHPLLAYGRLAPGVTPEAARRELNVIASRLAAAYPETDAGWSMFALTLPDQIVGDVRPALAMLLAAAGCVLLIGAANLANLFLVRNLTRERELAVRVALGATRGRLARELVAEALVLGAGAAAIGVALAIAGVAALRAFAPTGVMAIPRVADIAVDGRVVAFCVLTTMATVVIFGVLPAWQASRGDPAGAIKQGARGTGSGRHHRMQDMLVVLQVMIALVLLTGAGLLVETFARFEHADLGFRPDGVLTARVALSKERYPTEGREAAFATQLTQLLAAQPGVASASVSSALPTNPTIRWIFSIAGDPAPAPGKEPTFRPYFVGPDYFGTMGIALLRGRGLLPSDDARATRVTVIDERTARRFFAGRDPIGRAISLPGFKAPVEIVGIAASVRQGGLEANDVPVMYLPFAQMPLTVGTVVIAIRTHGSYEGVAETLRHTVATLDPLAPVDQIETLGAHVSEWVGPTRFSTFLASLFAAVALILGMVGIYSVLSYIVRQRRREIGLRLALGATHGHVMGAVLRHALVLASAGIVSGSIVAWWLTRGLANLFVGINPHDPTIFAGAAIVFALVAVVAAAVPAFRTTRVSPTVALQAE